MRYQHCWRCLLWHWNLYAANTLLGTQDISVCAQRLRCIALPLQLSDLLEDHAETISKKAPDVTENLQQKAEEQADKVSKNARPYADQASGAIEGGAKQVAEGTPLRYCPHLLCTDLELLDLCPDRSQPVVLLPLFG